MIKHGPGMALCLKYATNKVPSVAPLVVKLSHAAVCSRQISKQCIKSPFLHECLINSDTSSLTSPQDAQTFVDPSINHEQDREKKCEVTGYVLSLISEDENLRTTVPPRQSSFPCHCSTNLLSVSYHNATDSLRYDEISNSYHLHGKKRSVNCTSLHSAVEIQSSSPAKGEEGSNLNNAKNGEPLDPLKPPTEEQLQKVLNRLADDLPRFFIKPFTSDIYHKDIVFEDNIRGKRFSGINQYSLQAKLLYIFSHLRFIYVNLDVLKITSHLEDGTVKVRWKISVLRLRRLLGLKSVRETWIDGFSTYYVLGDGLIHKHVADKMMPDQEQMVKKENPTKSVPVPHPLAYSDRNKI